ncbi:MAG: hypothetical protein ACI4DO_05790 [Roseburia sp.]
MAERLKRYLSYMEEITSRGEKEQWSTEQREYYRRELLTQLQFFQHERLIHLIVTVTFALLTLTALLGCFVAETPMMFALVLALLILLVPYIRHYYILENGVQKLYTYYDALMEESRQEIPTLMMRKRKRPRSRGN